MFLDDPDSPIRNPLRFAGARSAAKGIKICGVTVAKPRRKLNACSIAKLTARPLARLKTVVIKVKININGFRGSKSPRGVRNRRPAQFRDGEERRKS